MPPLSSTVITVVPEGSPPSSVISSSSDANILNIRQSSFVVVTEGQVGEADSPFANPLIFIGTEESCPVILTIYA